MFYTYIIYSTIADKYYVGHTDDMIRRLHEHNHGLSRYTRTGKPWELVYSEEFETRAFAMRREREIKTKKSRKYIEKLIIR